MAILQIGVPKCGNFWLYQILQQILQKAGRDRKSFIQQQAIYQLAKSWDLNFPDQAKIDVLEITDLQLSYRISSIFRKPIEDLQQYIASTPHVWTHSPICKKSPEVLEAFAHKVYIIRDPRDRAISAAKYYCSPYMLKYFPQEETDPQKYLDKHFERLMTEWVWHVYDHLRVSKAHNIHIIFYENLLEQFQSVLGPLLQYLEIPLSSGERLAIEEAVSFSTLKAKNPKHLKKGKANYWREQLNTEQLRQAEMIAGPLLQVLNYSPSTDKISRLPSFSSGKVDFIALKESIIQSQQPLYEEK